MVCVCLITGLCILYALWDLNYFLRFIFTLGLGRIFSKKSGIRDKTTIYGLCTTHDVDIFLRHMNNARYLRELDFARFHYYDRSGIYAAIRQRGGGALQGASSVRYRRTIPIFTMYKVETQLIYWDEKAIYIRQRFITISDGFVRAEALSKQNVVGVSPLQLMKEVPGGADSPPEPSEDLKLWLQSIEASSAALRKKD
ncbi:protein THEM6-like [Ctenocephalides felis]|uniref:protein THEM6-like n=1 Tax=Ctenocephalides felis TaxID=7515 RepID=UPI000E6E3F97|nr:protein THEM6-like [Ctenocephalides felis]